MKKYSINPSVVREYALSFSGSFFMASNATSISSFDLYRSYMSPGSDRMLLRIANVTDPVTFRQQEHGVTLI